MTLAASNESLGLHNMALSSARMALDDAAKECKTLMDFHEALGGLNYYIGASQCEGKVRALRSQLDEG